MRFSVKKGCAVSLCFPHFLTIFCSSILFFGVLYKIVVVDIAAVGGSSFFGPFEVDVFTSWDGLQPC